MWVGVGFGIGIGNSRFVSAASGAGFAICHLVRVRYTMEREFDAG